MKRILKTVSLVLCFLFVMSPMGLFAGAEELSALDFKSEAESALVIPSEGKVVPGDMNGDGAFAVRDSLLLKKYLLGITTNVINGAADVNCDGITNSKDVLCLKKHLAGTVGAKINTASASVAYAGNMKAARITARYDMPAVDISAGEVSSESYPFAVFSYILPETDNSEVILHFGSFTVKLDLIADGV